MPPKQNGRGLRRPGHECARSRHRGGRNGTGAAALDHAEDDRPHLDATKGELDEREVLGRVADFGSLWAQLFPAEQARIMKLLVERVDVLVDGLEVRLRAEGLASLVAELREQPLPAKAA